MLDWWQWLLFPRSTLLLYGIDPRQRIYWVGHKSALSLRYAPSIGYWGHTSRELIADTMQVAPSVLTWAEQELGLSASWSTKRVPMHEEYSLKYGFTPKYKHLALMQLIYENEMLRMKNGDPRSVPLAAYELDAGAKRRRLRRYGILQVEIVRWFQIQVQILREYRIKYSVWRSWDEEQKQAAWIHGAYIPGIPDAARAWLAEQDEGRHVGVSLDPTREAVPPPEIPLGDLRGAAGVTSRYTKAPRTLLR